MAASHPLTVDQTADGIGSGGIAGVVLVAVGAKDLAAGIMFYSSGVMANNEILRIYNRPAGTTIDWNLVGEIVKDNPVVEKKQLKFKTSGAFSIAADVDFKSELFNSSATTSVSAYLDMVP
jgi:hypothetical protein